MDFLKYENNKTFLSDALIFEVDNFEDSRGRFYEAFNKKNFLRYQKKFNLVQINESISNNLVARGMHLQKEPFSQNKIVRVIKGKVLDIIFDLRKKSILYEI